MAATKKRYLLDTHALMWLIGQPESLSKRASEIILYDDCELYYSHINFWEIAIKVSNGKLKMTESWQTVFEQAIKISGIHLIAIDQKAITLVQNLPFLHKDPFDRMLIAQAKANDLSLISADKHCHAYDLQVVW